MNYNYNINDAPEYDLNASLIDEVINLYGIKTKFLKVQKLNIDSYVFKDYSGIKTNATDTFEVFMLPENSEGWDNAGYNFSQFGLVNMDNINLYCSKFSMEALDLDIKHVLGNLVILPNNKIMEITNCEFEVPGVNNLFTYNNYKSVYKFSLRPYNVKLTDELDNVDILHPATEEKGRTSYDTLDKYFDELVNNKVEIDRVTEILDTVQTIDKSGTIDVKINKPIISREEDDVFGNF